MAHENHLSLGFLDTEGPWSEAGRHMVSGEGPFPGRQTLDTVLSSKPILADVGRELSGAAVAGAVIDLFVS